MTTLTDLTVRLLTRSDADLVSGRAQAQGINVDLRRVGVGTSPFPWQVKVHGVFPGSVTTDTLLAGVEYEMVSLRETPADEPVH